MHTQERYDLVVVGTGFHGLSVAKTYLEVHPSASVQLYDCGPTPGGVWSADRLYPGLKTNNYSGKYEFGDFPMVDPNLEKHQHIPAKTVHNYLQDYADQFDLVRRTQFNAKVETVEEQGGNGWLLTVTSIESPHTGAKRVFASKLVVAAGLTSAPSMPKFVGEENFNTALFHGKDFAARADGLKSCKGVVVFSGGKSAWDVAYAYAAAGIQVDWVIRSSGHGPCWMVPTRVLGPLKVIAENLINMRIVTWFSPCIYGEADGFTVARRFLNQTRIGRKLIDGFSYVLQLDASISNGYDNHPETKKLKPWRDIFWTGSNRGLLNYETDVFQLVRDGKIKIHIADITHLSDHKVHLSDSTTIETDALICCTGWKHSLSMKFLRNGQDITAELGLPHHSDAFPSPLIHKADAEILEKFPRLRDQPTSNYKVKTLPPTTPQKDGPLNVPYRLYRFMIPPAHIHSRTIAFAGVVRSASTTWLAQAQALWITAFLGGNLPHLAHTGEEFDRQIEYETILHSRFGLWRYPAGFGRCFPDFFFDAMPYVDLCLAELGLRFRRKSNMYKEIFEPYGPKDYKTLTQEWLLKEQEHADFELSEKTKIRNPRKGSKTAWPKQVLVSWSANSVVGKSLMRLLANIAGLLVLLSVFTSGVMAMA